VKSAFLTASSATTLSMSLDRVSPSERLGLHCPERVEDLAGGAGRLIQRPDGYVETLVLGRTVVAEGELTDATPGGLVRGRRPAPVG
jgi:N-acyl-D-amino-acid deacylase